MIAPQRVLLVDDDAPFRKRLALAFEARKWKVTACANSAEALMEAKVRKFDGAIVDLRMPGMDGMELVKELRAMEGGLFRIVVLTGYGSITTALEAVRLGASDYLTKPADVENIISALLGEEIVRQNPKNVSEETPSLNRVEWEYIQRVLNDCKGNISQAARFLGINRRSLQRKLGKYPPTR